MPYNSHTLSYDTISTIFSIQCPTILFAKYTKYCWTIFTDTLESIHLSSMIQIINGINRCKQSYESYRVVCTFIQQKRRMTIFIIFFCRAIVVACSTLYVYILLYMSYVSCTTYRPTIVQLLYDIYLRKEKICVVRMGGGVSDDIILTENIGGEMIH